MRVLVTGSRDWDDIDRIQAALLLLPPGDHTIVHGGARGADSIADDLARHLGHQVERHPARWAEQGKAAGVIRNQKMLDSGIDLCLAFQKDANSRGTADMVRRAKAAGVPVQMWGWQPE